MQVQCVVDSLELNSDAVAILDPWWEIAFDQATYSDVVI